MSIEESIVQLNSLIEHFGNGGSDINATDIIAIEVLLEKNIELTKQNEFLMKRENKLQVLEIKEKELIKWLENMLEDETDIFSVVRVKDVLQKHKKIIGSNNKKNE